MENNLVSTLFDDVVYERLRSSLHVGDRITVTSHLFHDFQDDSDRVALAYELLMEEDLFPDLPPPHCGSRKCGGLAADLRSEGNTAFRKKLDLNALVLYNQSLAAAPFQSKEFALAIANRSAVNFSLGFFEACLKDIELAAVSGYPEELRIKLLERRAKCLLKMGCKADAGKAIKVVMEEWEKSPDGQKILKKSSIEALSKELVTLLGEPITNKCPIPSEFGCLEVPQLSYGLNPEIACASDCIALQYSKDKGRHLVAAMDIQPGDVLMIEQPYASTLLPHTAMTHCYNCLAHCLSPVPCFHCTEVLFCDEKCRSKCWERFHSMDCPIMSILFQNVGKMGLLALRMLLVATRKGTELKKLYEEIEDLPVAEDMRTLGFNLERRYVSSDYWPMHHLVGHSASRSTSDLFRRSVTAACLLHCLENRTDFFGPDADNDTYFFCGGFILKYLQSLPCNAHEVSEMNVKMGSFKSDEIGAAGYAALSLLNHSCDPNVVRHSYKDWAVLRAIRSIREGEDILDNYGYHHALHMADSRKVTLSNQYFFQCECEACEKEWPLYRDQPTTDPVYKCKECGKGLRKELYTLIKVPCVCGAFTDLDELNENLRNSSKFFIDTLSTVLAGQRMDEVPQTLIDHLVLLELSIERPWREFSECQETIKQCLSLQANHTIINKQSDSH